jgi:hypothetical protein
MIRFTIIFVILLLAVAPVEAQIAVSPDFLSANLMGGQITTQKLTISNVGTTDLRFDAKVRCSRDLGNNTLNKVITVGSSLLGNPLRAGVKYKSDQLIVRFKKRILSKQAMSIRSDLHATVTKKFPLIGAELWNLSGVSVADAIERCKNNPDIEYCEPNYEIHFLESIPNDPDFSQLWGMQKISAPVAWI